MTENIKNAIEELKKITSPRLKFFNEQSLLSFPSDFLDFKATRVDIDPKEDFTTISGGASPKPRVLSAIAEAAGIDIINNSVVPIYEEIDWNNITGQVSLSGPILTRYLVGYQATVTAQRIKEDGTIRTETQSKSYNFFDRCVVSWVKNTNKPPTQSQRLTELFTEKKYCYEKALTGAKSRAILGIMGLQKAFSYQDLIPGYFLIGKVIKADGVLNKEFSARIKSIENKPYENPIIKQEEHPQEIKIIDPVQKKIYYPPSPEQKKEEPPAVVAVPESRNDEESEMQEQDERRELLDKMNYYLSNPVAAKFLDEVIPALNMNLSEYIKNNFIKKIETSPLTTLYSGMEWVESKIPEDCRKNPLDDIF